MRALVVDDARTVRRMLIRMLQELGFETREAETGIEALEILDRDKAFELALVDWNMPEMSGLELVERVRARPDLRELRILMVTTESAATKLALALEKGADEYLMKPFEREGLAEKLALLGWELEP